MSGDLVVRRRHRRAARRGSRAAHLRVGRAFSAGHTLAIPSGGEIPSLTLPEPEGGRRALVSGSLAVLVHGLAIGIMILIAWLAPEVVEELIEVKIIRELPGSNTPPPAPKQIQARRPAAMAAIAPQALAQPAQPIAPVQVSAEAIRMDRIDTAVAPTPIAVQEVQSQRVDVQQSITTPRVAAATDLRPVDVRPTDINAPVARVTGPRQVAAATQVNASAPEAFANLPRTTVQHTGQASLAAGAWRDSGFEFEGVDTGVATELMAGTPGGSGSETGTVPCLQSAYVNRYLDLVKERTLARWDPPAGTPADAPVVVRFDLDGSGSAADIVADDAATRALGESVVRAIRDASPFPPMDDNVRCLTEKRIKATFNVPSL